MFSENDSSGGSDDDYAPSDGNDPIPTDLPSLDFPLHTPSSSQNNVDLPSPDDINREFT